jgi:hypothetical protein
LAKCRLLSGVSKPLHMLLPIKKIFYIGEKLRID